VNDIRRSADNGVASPTPDARGPSVRDLSQPALDVVAANPDVFGGAFLDPSGTNLCVLVAEDSAGRAEEILADALPRGIPIGWVPVKHSQAELDEVQSELIELWREVGIEQINAISVDLRMNVVVVSMPEANEDLAGRIITMYGDSVKVVVERPDRPA
jgi:hypothetical protein